MSLFQYISHLLSLWAILSAELRHSLRVYKTKATRKAMALTLLLERTFQKPIRLFFYQPPVKRLPIPA